MTENDWLQHIDRKLTSLVREQARVNGRILEELGELRAASREQDRDIGELKAKHTSCPALELVAHQRSRRALVKERLQTVAWSTAVVGTAAAVAQAVVSIIGRS